MLLICFTFVSVSAKEEGVKEKSASTSIKSIHLVDAKRQAGEIRASRSEVRKPAKKKQSVSHSSHSKPKGNNKKHFEKKRPEERKTSLTGIAACIAKYESGGNPRAENPNSTASGLYQFIKGTWNNYKGYAEAKDAPVSVQTEKFYQVWDNGRGASQWVVSGRCGY
jgi:hypothetical protein